MNDDILWKDSRHSHFWIEDGQLFESYQTIRGLRYRYRMDVKGMPDTDTCTDADIWRIKTEYMMKQYNETKYMMKQYNEYALSVMHGHALAAENYELCGAIQAEINARIEQNTICHAFMQGFRYYNTEEKKFEGPYRTEGMNGLFDKYVERYPAE